MVDVLKVLLLLLVVVVAMDKTLWMETPEADAAERGNGVETETSDTSLVKHANRSSGGSNPRPSPATGGGCGRTHELSGRRAERHNQENLE